eukprot:Lithocolla_globosa_v1_NODE_442_length_4041_cov_30.407677.p5 type:complete len:244 gc:universal NODE_442_length_4041_cov_30.407677:3786-3055(-)
MNDAQNLQDILRQMAQASIQYTDNLSDCDPMSTTLQETYDSAFEASKSITVPERFATSTTKPAGASHEVGSELASLGKIAKMAKGLLQLVVRARTTPMVPDDFLAATAVAATTLIKQVQTRSGELWVSSSFSQPVAKTFRALKSNPHMSAEDQKRLLEAIELQNRLERSGNSGSNQSGGSSSRGQYNSNRGGFSQRGGSFSSYRGGSQYQGQRGTSKGQRQFNYYSDSNPNSGNNPNNGNNEW